MNEKEETIAVQDSTPSILEQAKNEGWNCQYYHFGKAEALSYEWFNPSIVERSDGLWLLCRGSEPHPSGFEYGQNSVWAFMLDETGTIPKMGKRLKWRDADPEQHFEDPRGFYYPRLNQTLVGACTFRWYKNEPWTGSHQCFGAFDADWNCVRMAYPKIGGNPGVMTTIDKKENYEKNWLWWLAEDRLHLLYKARPWRVYRFGESWEDRDEFKEEAGADWAWGEIRGGTPPIKVGDLYFTFHHSSVPWKGRYRRYYAGCLAFEGSPPYRPVSITRNPLLIGSQNDPWAQTKPLVVFPCGAIYRGDKWFITLGVNDMKAAWLTIPHDLLLGKMTPLHEAPQEIFGGSEVSPNDQKIFSDHVPTSAEAATWQSTPEKLSGGEVGIRDGASPATTPSLAGSPPTQRKKRKRKRMSAQARENCRAAALRVWAAKKNKDLGDSMDANTAPDPNVCRDQIIRGA